MMRGFFTWFSHRIAESLDSGLQSLLRCFRSIVFDVNRLVFKRHFQILHTFFKRYVLLNFLYAIRTMQVHMEMRVTDFSLSLLGRFLVGESRDFGASDDLPLQAQQRMAIAAMAAMMIVFASFIISNIFCLCHIIILMHADQGQAFFHKVKRKPIWAFMPMRGPQMQLASNEA